jgi:hypothetical protein
MKLNLKKWIKSMLWYLLAFALLGIAMVVLGYWTIFSKEIGLLLLLGFSISGIINALSKDNYN